MCAEDNLTIKTIGKLLVQAGIEGQYHAERLVRGSNNQAFRVYVNDDTFFCKAYFTNKSDTRKRLQAERTFLQSCQRFNISSVPTMLASSDENNIALFSFMEGKPYQKGEVLTLHDVLSAKNFLEQLFTVTPLCGHLQNASDACFSFEETLVSVENRIKNVCNEILVKEHGLYKDVKNLLANKLLPRWEKIECEVKQYFGQSERFSRINILSPSDFGFHNALKSSEKVFFLDFEYAGLDGCVKLLCDFFCQPQVPVSLDYLPIMLEAFQKASEEVNVESLRLCVLKMLPLCRIKWCFIMLNQFTSLGAERRSYALSQKLEEQQRQQLQKIEKYCNYFL